MLKHILSRELELYASLVLAVIIPPHSLIIYGIARIEASTISEKYATK